ncbi:MAG: hypothetical protein H6737_32225 [Alphaproteobacteria bacterium]|nr:hypothetical protein [Alphaproteobacteria bacterium]
MPKPNDRTPKHPAFLEAARAFYADAFEHRRKKDLAAAMEEWTDLEAPEQTFAIAHLLYLNLKAQADTLRVLVDVRDLLDEVADGVDQALDADADDDDDEPTGDDDTAPGDLDGDAVRAPAVDDSSTTSTPDTDAAPVEGV